MRFDVWVNQFIRVNKLGKFRVLPKSWDSKVDVIKEARDRKTLTMDELIGNLQTHELNKKHDHSKKDGKKNKSLYFEASPNDLSENDEE